MAATVRLHIVYMLIVSVAALIFFTAFNDINTTIFLFVAICIHLAILGIFNGLNQF